MCKLKLCFTFLSLLTTAYAVSDQCLDPANDPENICRPCPNFDVNCIRDYFTAHSKCQLALGPVRDPLFLHHYTLDFPIANVTTEVYNVYIGNTDGAIVEFYVNFETRKMVLAFEVHNLTLDSEDVVFKYNRKARESIVRKGSVRFDYGTITHTIIFPNFMKLNLSRAEVFTYVENSHPKYSLGRELYSSQDTVAKKEFEVLVKKLPVDLRQGFLMQGKIIMENYIQDNICDFGLDLTTDEIIRKTDKRASS